MPEALLRSIKKASIARNSIGYMRVRGTFEIDEEHHQIHTEAVIGPPRANSVSRTSKQG